MFKRQKPTFLRQAGMLGAPSARRVLESGATKRRAKNGAYKMSKKGRGKAKSFPMARKIKTTKPKGVLNSFKMSKKAPTPKRAAYDKKNSNFFMAKKGKGSNPREDNIDKRLQGYFSGIKGGLGYERG